MKLRISYFRQLLLAALIISFCQFEVRSQKADSIKLEKPGFFVGFSFGPAQSYINNTGTTSVSKLLSTKENSIFGSIDLGYFFSKYFGLSSGIGFNSYKTKVTLDSYDNTLNGVDGIDAVDTENDGYRLRVSGSKIIEDQKVGFITIPVCINLRLPLGKIAGFFLQPGVNLAVPLSKTFESSGTFTYKGYYPVYNVLLQNLPDYGFPTDLSSSSSGKLDLKPLNFNVVASAGFDILIQNRYLFGVAACYDRSLLSIAESSSADKFQLSSDVGNINSLMSGSSKTITQSMGIKIVFRYYLK
jgi:hypothetical protein